MWSRASTPIPEWLRYTSHGISSALPRRHRLLGDGCLLSVLLGLVVTLPGGVHRGHLVLQQPDQLK